MTQTEKSTKFCILRFSRNEFLRAKTEVFPLFLGNGSADRAEIFLQVLQTFWGVYFFWFVEILLLKDSVAFTTGAPSRPSEGLQYFASHFGSRRYFSKKKKKYTPHFGSSCCKKNFSPIGRPVSEKKGENFLPCDSRNPMKTSSDKVECMTTFGPLIEM